MPTTVPPPHRPGPPLSVPAGASRRAAALAAAADVACVLGFVVAGRASHDGSGGLGGALGTAWPFLLAAAVGWLCVRAWRHPTRVWPTGVVVWAVTWAAGLALRGLAGDGLAPAFVAVSAVVLAVLLLGWRAVATAVSRTRGRRRATRPAPGR